MRNASVTAWLALLWIVCAIAPPVQSQAQEAQSQAQQAQSFDYREIVLDNGLRVISLEDFSTPIAAVHLWYHVGSKDEDSARQGFAHMFEHMMFRGTDRLGSTDHFDLIRKTGGTCNAYTTFDQTVYTQTLPANQLELVLWLEAERMSMLKIDQTAFDTERKVVEEERRMGLNRPYGKLLEKALPELFPNHPYRWSTIGSIPDLRAASVPELRAFWTKYYVPNNATLVVVGAVTHAEVQQLAKRNFGWIPRGNEPPRVAPPEMHPFAKREVVITEKNAPAPLTGLLFRGVPMNHPDATAIELMTTILGGGSSSRLYRRVVAEEESAVLALSAGMSLEQDGMIAAGAVLSPLGSNPDKVLASIAEEIARMQNEPVSDAELEKARNQMLKQLIVESLTVDSKAAAIGQAAVLEGDVARVNTRADRIRNVTAADIQRVAKTYLDPDHAITGKVKGNLLGSLTNMLGIQGDKEDAPITGEKETEPVPPGRPGVQRPADRSAASPLAPMLALDLNQPYQELVLDNGLTVIVVENREVPYVNVQLGLEAGAWTETIPGSASMALSMLTKGTESLSEKELASELETYAIALDGSADMDSSSVVLGGLPEQMDRGMRLMSDIVRRNTMPETEFRKLKKQLSTSLAVSEKTPVEIANRELRKRLYGDHPYGRTTTGTVADLKALELDTVRAWWQRFARPDMATLIFSGDIDIARAGTLAKTYFGAWQASGPAPEVTLPPLPERSPTHIYLVDNDSVQSEIRVGHRAMTVRDADYAASRVVNGYFGGAFSSRLNETIRVKKGLTYGARGGFSSRKSAGEFAISTFSKTDSTLDTVQTILTEVQRLTQEAPSTKELENTVSYFVGSYPATRETSQQVASEIWSQRVMGLPEDYTQKLLATVSNTTADECLKIAQRQVHAEELVIVVVGPASKLQAGLEAIAPVTVVK
ncbi:MAG: M16 family metallopeptidase [Pirellula sp.]